MVMADLVHLIRHGEVHNPRHLVYASLPEFHLSPLGVRQAEAAGHHLARRPLVAVWSSPLRRARETARKVAAVHGLEVQVLPDLREWRLLDRWAGIPWEQVHTLFPGEVEAYLSHPGDLPFTGETLEQLADRIAVSVRRVAAGTVGGEVALVGHQDPLQAGRLRLTEKPLNRLFADRPGHCTVITLRPGSAWTEVESWSPSIR